LDCGILKNGIARVRCEDYGYEFLLVFFCKRRHPRFHEGKLLPPCHQKQVVEFREWLCEEVIKVVPHRHLIFSMPKQNKYGKFFESL